MARTLGILIVCLVILATLVFAFWPEPAPVDLAAVTRGPMMVTIDEEGETRVRDVYVVSAPLTGRVDRIEAQSGDPVVAGQTILASMQETDPSFLDLRARRRAEAAIEAAAAAYEYAEAERVRAEAELDYARAEWERARTLADRGTISAAQLDRARLALRTEEAALATAEASLSVRASELDNARAELIDPGTAGFDQPAGGTCCVPVLAPINGRVLRVLHESESIVASGTPLIEVGDPEDMEVVVDLLSAEAVKVSPGDQAFIEDWGGEGALAGVVRRIEPYAFTKVSALGIEEQRVNVVIDLSEPPDRWRGLGHGFRVEVRIVEWQNEDVSHLPISALFRRGEDWATFAAVEGVAELRILELGHINADYAELRNGLADGDHVVLHPSDRITDGTPIVERDLE